MSDEDEREGTILDDGGIDTGERAGRSQGIDTTSEPDDEVKETMAEEREQRLDPDNRPEHAEIDNTERDFDHEQGMFTDNEEYDDSAEPQYSGVEGSSSDDKGSSGDDSSDEAAAEG